MASAVGAIPLLTIEVRQEHDVVLARQRARHIAALLGFGQQEQTRIATALSELARNAYEYARGGRVVFQVQRESGRAYLVISVEDRGPGIARLDDILDGNYVSSTGMGLGIVGARRLVERFHIESTPGQGTRVEIGARLPVSSQRFAAADAGPLTAALAQQSLQSPLDELQRQNQELVRALDDSRMRQSPVERLNAELEETNRGVLALYAELDDRAVELRSASEYKSRFLSDISHELRTPLTSVLNLSRLLLDRTDGDLTREQEHQVRLIKSSVEMVTDLVNELLDLARIEAGRMTLTPTDFEIDGFFASLRAICRPLLSNDAVQLVFEDRTGGLTMHTDEKRLAQILRNFLSNAIKFTERGEIRVTASLDELEQLHITVRDTGIGIARENLPRIFEEFVQVDGPIQRRVRGTGLGLPLTRKLAALLGGHVDAESEPGVGSTFRVVIPRTDAARTDDVPLRSTEAELR